MTEQIPRPCIFFDRDGVVNESPGLGKYVTCWEDFHFSDGIFEVLRSVFDAGLVAVLVTSQRGVARGLMTQETLTDIHQRMQERIEKETGGSFLDIQACTDDIGVGNRRKPSPEMIFEAAEEHFLDIANSWMIGDHDRDIEMAHNAGIPASRTVRIRGDHEITYPAAFTLDSVAELAERTTRILSI